MKKHFLLLCALVPVLGFAQTAAPRPDVDELFAVMRMDKMMENMMAPVKNMLGGMGQSANQSPEAAAKAKARQEKTFALIFGEMTGSKMKAEMTQIYAETFTPDEIKGITVFYKSPAGQAFLDKQPILMQKSIAMSQKIMMDVMPKMQEMMANDAKADAKEKMDLPAGKPALKK